MPSKRYRRISEEASTKQPAASEVTARSYARERDKKTTLQIALSIATVKRKLKKPVKRSKRETARALEIAGIGDGLAGLSENAPRWLRRMDLVKAEMKTIRFPRTAQEGFRQCAELSETARRWFRQSIGADHPGASEEEIEKERQLFLARLCAAQSRRIAKWKKELDRYFRG
jgi:hypothetical protein